MGHFGKPDCKMGMPCVAWGKSGIAKTAIVRQIAASLELQCETIMPAQHQPEDFGTLPVVLGNELKRVAMLDQVEKLNKVGKGVLFLDEASGAVPATQGALLGVILDRKLGSIDINPNVRILAAANPPKYAAGGWGLEAPMSNRMAHFLVECPSVRDVVRYLMSDGDLERESLAALQNRLAEGWGTNWPAVKGQLAGFWESQGSFLHMQPEPEHPQAGYGWPSPRSWEMAGRAVATARSLGLAKDTEVYLIEGCVGKGAATAFLEWLATADLPAARDVLEKGWKIDKKRLDRTVAVYTSLLSYVKGIPDQTEQYNAAAQVWKRLKDLFDAGVPDLAMESCETMTDMKLGRRGTPQNVKVAAEAVILEMGKSGLAKYARER
jgi:hypothetical protein